MKIRSRILLPLAPALLGLPGVVLAASPARDPRVEIVTDMGTIVVQLAPSRAPRTVENFLRYVREGHYAGTVFHRVIQGFMIQGGGFTAEMQQKPVHDPIPTATSIVAKAKKLFASQRESEEEEKMATQLLERVKKLELSLS